MATILEAGASKTAPTYIPTAHSTTKYSTFLTIPAELRLKIYHHLFHEAQISYCDETTDSRDREFFKQTDTKAVDVLLSCRRIYEEARPALLDLAHINFSSFTDFAMLVDRAKPVAKHIKRAYFHRCRFGDADFDQTRIMPRLEQIRVTLEPREPEPSLPPLGNSQQQPPVERIQPGHLRWEHCSAQLDTWAAKLETKSYVHWVLDTYGDDWLYNVLLARQRGDATSVKDVVIHWCTMRKFSIPGTSTLAIELDGTFIASESVLKMKSRDGSKRYSIPQKRLRDPIFGTD